MKKKVLYEAPVVEVLDARVEKGFAGSIISSNPESQNNGYGTQALSDGNTYLWN